MLRAVTLSLILLATVATTLPAGQWLAEAALRGYAAQPATPRRHSRAWWRRYRARVRRQRALAAVRRRRRWTVRRRPAAQLSAPARVTLAQALRPVELPDASPSSLVSIAAIEQQVAAPAPPAQAQPALFAQPAAAHVMQSAATQSAATTRIAAAQPTNANASKPAPAKAQPSAQPASVAPSAPVLAHAPQQKIAGDQSKPANAANVVSAANGASAANTANVVNAANAAPSYSAPAASHATSAAPAASAAPAQSASSAASHAPVSNFPASKLAASPALPRLASAIAPVAPALTRTLDGSPLTAGPVAKGAQPAPPLTGRDPRKFSALPAPHNWLGVSSTLGGEYKFSLRASDGRQSGVAVWSRVNLSAQAPTNDRRNRTLGGVAHASLRRTVIDRMFAEGGWVVNDFEREIAGQKVFVVVAQSESAGLRRAWTYYFVELDGQLYSLSTTAPTEFADSVASEAEQTLSALASRRDAPRN